MLAVYLENKQVSLRDVPMPTRPKDWALIRVLYSGICNTDLELSRGYYNFAGIPGHEFVGEVVEADKVELVGKRVVGDINIACLKCEFCANLMYRHCVDRTVLGIVKHPGAFAEYLTLPERNLHIVPDQITDQQAVFTEPLAAARSFLDQVHVNPGEIVAVLGDGKLGLLIVQVLTAHGCNVHHRGRHPEKLRLGKEFGAETRAEYLACYNKYDLLIEATGSSGGLADAVRLANPRALIILKSTFHGLLPFDIAPVVVNELRLHGSRCGSFPPALDLLRDRKVRVNELITATMPLASAPEAFERANTSGVLKILLKP